GARGDAELSPERRCPTFLARRCGGLRQGHVRGAGQLSELLRRLALHPRHARAGICRMLWGFHSGAVPGETELMGLAPATNSGMSRPMRDRFATARTTTTTC